MQSRRPHLILVALILLAIGGVVLIGAPGSPAQKHLTKGLDLQGGLEVVLKAVPTRGQKLDAAALNRSVTIIRNRIDKLGVSEPVVTKQGSNQISVQLPGVHDPNRAISIIGTTAQLELFDLEADLTGPSINASGVPIPEIRVYSLLTAVGRSKKGVPEAYYLFDQKKLARANETVLADNAASAAKARADLLHKYNGKLPKGWKLLPVPHGTAVVSCGKAEVVCPGVNQSPPSRTYFYLFRFQPNDKAHPIPEMNGSDLKLSGTRQDFDPNTSEPLVLLSFTGKGGKKFHAITRDEAQRGSIRGAPQHFAIVLDREIKSWPQIDYKQYPDGIDPINGAQITGLQSLGEAKDLALVLQTGALPVNFVIAERTDVSATLGKDSLREAQRAAIVGLLVVALFLLLLYRFLGLVAVLGLAIYVAFLYAAILIFGVTLTLPGFAGMILTIGVAADANVVVFERIKEEVRAGKSVRAAISAGYAKGFRTILDANVVTCITALVLFAVATAGVKGFALMLLIGTVISLLTAVAATRAMLGLLAGFRWFDNPRFMGAHGQQHAKWLQIDFMRRRNLWFAISGGVVVIGAVSLGVQGLNFGIDFKGGSQVSFKTAEPVSLSTVRDEASRIGRSDAIIQGRGKSVGGDKYSSFQMRMKSLTTVEQNRLSDDIKTKFGARSLGITTVSSSFGRQIARSAILAIIVSLLLIVFYITIRFDFKYALPVIIALIHDIAITVGVYSLTSREVTTSTVAAVLTVLGYSIYDTIIIFDRIRENVPLMRRASFATIANVSLWETIRRSLATSFITLLPVTALLLFGGATLKDFAFALLVGIASGAYSSIFIAAPLLTIWKEREPEFHRRIGEEGLHGKEEYGDGVPVDGGEPVERKRRRIGRPAVDSGTLALEEAEAAAAAQPAPSLGELTPQPAASASAQEKRERRRQRRRTRPHGRAR
jgi:SecD/SecF fusion protein